MFLKINGRLHYLWRAVDQDGDVLDIMVQSSRDKKAAKKLFCKLLKGLRYVPRVIITDKLKSYSAAKAEVLPGVAHCQQKYQNNRAENSHPPTKLRERLMRRFKSAGQGAAFSRSSESFRHTSEWADICIALAVTISDEIEIRIMG